MKQKETMLTTQPKEEKISLSELLIEEMGDQHKASSVETPLRADAFEKTDDEKIAAIEPHFRAIMEILGMDLRDDSLRGTPLRVAKMYVKELFQGLNPANMPSMTLFENKFQYNEMLVEKNINFYTNCEHHFVPFFGKAHVAYISSGKVIGLSKLNRLVEYFSKRPQVQERLTMQVGKALQTVLQTQDVAVMMDAKHLCVSSRGVKDDSSNTITTFFGGKFQGENAATGPTGNLCTCMLLLGNLAGTMRPYVRRASSAYHLIKSAAMAHSARASAKGLPCSKVSNVAICSMLCRIRATPFSRRAQRSCAGSWRQASNPV